MAATYLHQRCDVVLVEGINLTIIIHQNVHHWQPAIDTGKMQSCPVEVRGGFVAL